MNISCIIVDQPIAGLAGVSFTRCTMLAEVLAAMVSQAGTDIYAVNGAYDSATETIIITLSNGNLFSIPAAQLLPVVADGDSITGNGTAGNPLKGYKVEYDAGSGALTITPPGGAAVVIAAQTAGTEPAADTYDLLGNGAGVEATSQQLLDALAAQARPAGAALRSATATGVAQNVTTNPGFSELAYQQNMTATTGANSSITVQLAGRYLVTASVWWASEGWTHECGMHGLIDVNGSLIYFGGRLDHSRKQPTDPVNGGASKFLSYATAITCILPLNAGDVVRFLVIHDDIINHNLLAGNNFGWFQMEKLA